MLPAEDNCAAQKLARLATLLKTSTRRFGRLQMLGGKLKRPDALNSLGRLQNDSPKLQNRRLSFCINFNISTEWAVDITLPCGVFFGKLFGNPLTTRGADQKM